jgi:hypothetical protein
LNNSGTSFHGHGWRFWSLAITGSLALHAAVIGIVWGPTLLTNFRESSEVPAGARASAPAGPGTNQSAEPSTGTPSLAQSDSIAPAEPPSVSVMPSAVTPQAQSAPPSDTNRNALRRRHASSPKPHAIGKSSVSSPPELSGSPSDVEQASAKPAPREPLVPPQSAQTDVLSLAPEPLTDRTAYPPYPSQRFVPPPPPGRCLFVVFQRCLLWIH